MRGRWRNSVPRSGGITTVQRLKLHCAGTNVTDAGLVNLKGLTFLRRLSLGNTKVTDAGLAHLKGLTNLQQLTLPTQITDAGLVNLKGLTKLTWLNLYGHQDHRRRAGKP